MIIFICICFSITVWYHTKCNSIYCYEKTNEETIFIRNLINWIQTKWKLQSVRRYSLSIVACYFRKQYFSLMGKFLLCHGFHMCHYLTNVDNNKCVVVITNNCVHSSACKYNLDIDKLLFSKFIIILILLFFIYSNI